MTAKRGWAGVPYRQKSEAEWAGLNAQEAENREMRSIGGHHVVLVSQHRYGLDERVPTDFKVWVSCTCLQWMSGRWFPSVDAAVAAHKQDHMGEAA